MPEDPDVKGAGHFAFQECKGLARALFREFSNLFSRKAIVGLRPSFSLAHVRFWANVRHPSIPSYSAAT